MARKPYSPALSVAPMMDWTDRHCRYFHRQLSSSALLYTEMVTTGAVIHGDREHLLGFDPAEQPVALQLGGSRATGCSAGSKPSRCSRSPRSEEHTSELQSRG